MSFHPHQKTLMERVAEMGGIKRGEVQIFYGYFWPCPIMSAHMADKGRENGSCNREACQAPGATWLNRVNHAYYCPACAKLINSVDTDDGQPPLCSPPKAQP